METPLGENKQFLKDVEELIKQEIIAETIMGNKLSRFQVNSYMIVLV